LFTFDASVSIVATWELLTISGIEAKAGSSQIVRYHNATAAMQIGLRVFVALHHRLALCYHRKG
jgi:hypothetical protein